LKALAVYGDAAGVSILFKVVVDMSGTSRCILYSVYIHVFMFVVIGSRGC